MKGYGYNGYLNMNLFHSIVVEIVHFCEPNTPFYMKELWQIIV